MAKLVLKTSPAILDTCCLREVFFIFLLKNISSIIYRSVGDNRADGLKSKN